MDYQIVKPETLWAKAVEVNKAFLKDPKNRALRQEIKAINNALHGRGATYGPDNFTEVQVERLEKIAVRETYPCKMEVER